MRMCVCVYLQRFFSLGGRTHVQNMAAKNTIVCVYVCTCIHMHTHIHATHTHTLSPSLSLHTTVSLLCTGINLLQYPLIHTYIHTCIHTHSLLSTGIRESCILPLSRAPSLYWRRRGRQRATRKREGGRDRFSPATRLVCILLG